MAGMWRDSSGRSGHLGWLEALLRALSMAHSVSQASRRVRPRLGPRAGVLCCAFARRGEIGRPPLGSGSLGTASMLGNLGVTGAPCVRLSGLSGCGNAVPRRALAPVSNVYKPQTNFLVSNRLRRAIRSMASCFKRFANTHA